MVAQMDIQWGVWEEREAEGLCPALWNPQAVWRGNLQWWRNKDKRRKGRGRKERGRRGRPRTTWKKPKSRRIWQRKQQRWVNPGGSPCTGKWNDWVAQSCLSEENRGTRVYNDSGNPQLPLGWVILSGIWEPNSWQRLDIGLKPPVGLLTWPVCELKVNWSPL